MAQKGQCQVHEVLAKERKPIRGCDYSKICLPRPCLSVLAEHFNEQRA